MAVKKETLMAVKRAEQTAGEMVVKKEVLTVVKRADSLVNAMAEQTVVMMAELKAGETADLTAA